MESDEFVPLAVKCTGGGKKKTPTYLAGVSVSTPAGAYAPASGTGVGYNSPPEAWVSASSIAFGEHMMLKKVPPLLPATIGKCGQSMAMRKRP